MVIFIYFFIVPFIFYVLPIFVLTEFPFSALIFILCLYPWKIIFCFQYHFHFSLFLLCFSRQFSVSLSWISLVITRFFHNYFWLDLAWIFIYCFACVIFLRGRWFLFVYLFVYFVSTFYWPRNTWMLIVSNIKFA